MEQPNVEIIFTENARDDELMGGNGAFIIFNDSYIHFYRRIKMAQLAEVYQIYMENPDILSNEVLRQEISFPPNDSQAWPKEMIDKWKETPYAFGLKDHNIERFLESSDMENETLTYLYNLYPHMKDFADQYHALIDVKKYELLSKTNQDIERFTLEERKQMMSDIRRDIERNQDPDLDKRIRAYGELAYNRSIPLEEPTKQKILDPNYETLIEFFPMQLFSNGSNVIEYTNQDETIKTKLIQIADNQYTLSVYHDAEGLDSTMGFEIADKTVIFNEKMKNMEEIGFNIMLQIIKDNQLMIKDYPLQHEVHNQDTKQLKSMMENQGGSPEIMPEQKNNVKIINMSYLENKNMGLASIQYGDAYLHGLAIRERGDDGTPFVSYPAKQGKDGQYYAIYQFSNKKEYDHDKKAIEASLTDHYGKLKSGEISEVKNVPVSDMNVPDHYQPRVLTPHEFENGDKVASVTYGQLMINNVNMRQSVKVGEYVSMPAYKKDNGEWENHVVTTKGFKDAVLKSFHEKSAEQSKDQTAKQAAYHQGQQRE